tara:strand:+ start:1077 stop:1838 length:762 start_codon:yes stop_codon:yes gene_type:complete
MKFVIPSYKRSEILQAKTLKYLDEMGIDRNEVYVFIREDDTDYEGYKSIEGINLLAIDIKGIGATHNYITDHFSEGEFIIELDDDLDYLIDNERKRIKSFRELCETMKNKMEEEGCSYGGTYSVANPMFMSKCEEYTTDLRYCLGCLRFRFIRRDIKVETNFAEDMEHCILYFIRDGKILKNNWIAPHTKNYADGGCNGDGRNYESEAKDKKYLAEKYPFYCRFFVRKNGKPDCRIREYKSSIPPAKNKDLGV